jgi:hypothetical protein
LAVLGRGRGEISILRYMAKIAKNSNYKRWISELKLRIQQSQIKASVRINSSLIELYWNIGADITTKQAEAVWGRLFKKQLVLHETILSVLQSGKLN